MVARLRERAASAFRYTFGAEPRIFTQAPGRVNLIGEHTDYNDGFVLPVAIDFHIVMAAAPRKDNLVRAHSVDFVQTTEFSLVLPVPHSKEEPWSDYLRGVAQVFLEESLPLKGVDLAVAGDISVAGGLSSSAAVEVCTAVTLLAIANAPLPGLRLATLCQRAENQFVGLNCGIMDQFISSMAEPGRALLIDCRSLDYRAVPLWGSEHQILIADTRKPRGLVESEYNTRRAECEEAVRLLAEREPAVKALRDVSQEMLARHWEVLPERIARRARHVVSENQRVSDSVAALEARNLEEFGRLMYASHESLREDYEVSCAELDALVDIARKQEGVLGSRMTGAGFGGCTVTLVRSERANRVAAQLAREYQARTRIEPKVYLTSSVAGAGLIPAHNPGPTRKGDRR